jgi:pimeloyl-ACP methyl ester carboxylesterase
VGRVTGREAFTIEVPGGALGGWVAGSGTPVLLLHGGPGLSFSYLDGLAGELAAEFRVATFQQRGLAPSTVHGPFTVGQAVDDVVCVLDGLGWQRALVVGHSWGGHLALRVAATHPQRLLGALAVDPIGVVGDGGLAAFEAEVAARTPKAARERAQELDGRAMDGRATAGESLESLRLIWPAYFADPQDVPVMPDTQISVEAYAGIIGEITTGTDRIAAELAAGTVRYGIVAGAASPLPWGQAAQASAELSSRAFLEVVPGAGHFVWLDAPGRVRAALRRLTHDSATT